VLDVGLTYGPLLRGRGDPCSRFDADSWWHAMNTPAGAVTIRVHGGESARVDAWGPAREWAGEHAADIAGTADDPASFAPRDPFVAELHRRQPGLRVVRLRAAFDIAVGTILEQRVTSLEAHRSWRGLVRRHGTRAPGPADLFVPPGPDVLARIPDREWRRLGVEERRSATIRRVAQEASRIDRACATGDRLELRLRSVRGVGPWTAAHVLHYAAGDLDAVPVGDWHLPRHVGYALAGEMRADDARMLELLEPFRPQRARALRLIVAGTSGPPRRAPRARIHDLIRAEAARPR
jgi:3-methyladenine DNA glycosylase/8-oxoguanine DNA glycosylase